MRRMVTAGQMGLMRGTSAMAAPRKYSLELRERAVRMYRTAEPKPVIKRLAVEPGGHSEALSGWIRQEEVDAGERDDRLTTAERGASGDGAPRRAPRPGSRARTSGTAHRLLHLLPLVPRRAAATQAAPTGRGPGPVLAGGLKEKGSE
jgi:transposase-like protein